MLNAVIFDFDGVIADTEHLHFKAFLDVLEPEGLPFSWEEYQTLYIGFDDRDAVRERFRRANRPLNTATTQRLLAAKAQAFIHRVERDGAPLFPGVEALLRALSGTMPLGLCSGALRSDIAPILHRAGLDRVFDAMVTAEDVHASKPDPACYLQCLEKLAARFPMIGISAEKAVAIEDTPTGMKAARGAGLRVLGVTNSHPAAHLQMADRVVDTLEDVAPTTLREWF